MNYFTEVMSQTLPYVLSDGNGISEDLFPMMIKSVMNEKAGREYFRRNSRFMGNTGLPGAPTISEDDLAFIEDSTNSDARRQIRESQEKRAQNLGALMLYAVRSDGSTKRQWSAAVKTAVEQALLDEEPISACGVKLLRNLLISKRYPELLHIYRKAWRQRAAYEAAKWSRYANQNAHPNSSKAASTTLASSSITGSNEISMTELEMTMKTVFFEPEDKETVPASSGVIGSFAE
jgi:hypothetical protein